nr:pumilio 23 [Tanacetum cinerariifolium]
MSQKLMKKSKGVESGGESYRQDGYSEHQDGSPHTSFLRSGSWTFTATKDGDCFVIKIVLAAGVRESVVTDRYVIKVIFLIMLHGGYFESLEGRISSVIHGMGGVLPIWDGIIAWLKPIASRRTVKIIIARASLSAVFFTF